MVSSGNLYLACDWEEWKEKCYNEEKADVSGCVYIWCMHVHVHSCLLVSLVPLTSF